MSSIKDNIYASLRKFLSKPEATEAELDQALTDQVEAQCTKEQDTSNSIDNPPSEEAKKTVEQSKAEAPKEEVNADSNWGKLFARLDQMDKRISKVEQQPAGQETSYEEKGTEKGGDKTDRYLCPNTRKALGL